MAIPEADVARIRRWAHNKTPDHVRDKVWVEADVAGHAVTVFDCAQGWPDPSGPPLRSPVARLRYVAARREWNLYWCDRNSRFHRYETPPANDVATLLAALDEDTYCLFWG